MAGVIALRGDLEIQRTRTTGGGATVVSGDNPETSLVVEASETSLKSHHTTLCDSEGALHSRSLCFFNYNYQWQLLLGSTISDAVQAYNRCSVNVSKTQKCGVIIGEQLRKQQQQNFLIL